jgi:hypothetical protein
MVTYSLQIMQIRPILAYSYLDLQRDLELYRVFHAALDDVGNNRYTVFPHFKEKFVVDLKKEADFVVLDAIEPPACICSDAADVAKRRLGGELVENVHHGEFDSSGVYKCKSKENDLKHGNYTCKSEVMYLVEDVDHGEFDKVSGAALAHGVDSLSFGMGSLLVATRTDRIDRSSPA